MAKPSVKLAIVLFVLIIQTPVVNAVVYNWDVGPVGPANGPFDPNVMQTRVTIGPFLMPGPNAERVEVMFDDMKHLLIEPDTVFNSPSNLFFDRAELDVDYDNFGSDGNNNFVADVTVGFLDMNGQVIYSTTINNKVFAAVQGDIGTEFLGETPLIAHGVFIDFDPDFGPIGFPGIDTTIEFSIVGNVTVGEWVPEPASAALLALGGVVLLRRRSP